VAAAARTSAPTGLWRSVCPGIVIGAGCAGADQSRPFQPGPRAAERLGGREAV